MAMSALVQCTFHGNTAPDGSSVSCDCSAEIDVDACIVADGFQGEGLYCSLGSIVTCACTDIHGNAGGDWVGPIAGQLGQNGNISADPLFCSPESGDFTLGAESPCAPEHSQGCGQIGAHPVGCGLTPVESEAMPESRVVLAPNVPNPFNPATEIRFTLPAAGPAHLAVYTVQGRLVTDLVNGIRPAGDNVLTWRGVDAHGRDVPSGAYLAVLEAAGVRRTREMVLLR